MLYWLTICLKPRVRGTSASLSSAWVGLQKRVFTGVITLFILGAICTAPKASQRARSARRAEEGKRQLFPLPRRAPTHTECGFKVLDPKGLDPKGEGSPKIAEIVYNVTKDITT